MIVISPRCSATPFAAVPVTEGQPLYLLEADKSANEVESPASGTLRIVAQPGETYEVGTILGTIE